MMRRTPYPAIAAGSRRETLLPVAFTSCTLLVIAACGDVKTPREVAAASAPIPTTPVVANAERPTTEPSSTTPTNVTYDEAEAAYAERRYAEAVEMFQAYTGRRPDNAWGHYMLGLSAWKAGDLARAESAFVAALERDPRHVKSLLNLSRVLVELDRPKDALARVTTALELDPKSDDAHRLMGRVRSELGETDEALESYRRALSLNEQDVWSMNNMGLLLIQSGRYEEALRPLARAAQLDRTSAVFQNNLGIALERTGHFTAAADAYRAALAIDSTYSKADVSLARVSGLAERPESGEVDLVALAEEFAADVATWREEPVLSASPGIVDSALHPATPSDSAVTPHAEPKS